MQQWSGGLPFRDHWFESGKESLFLCIFSLISLRMSSGWVYLFPKLRRNLSFNSIARGRHAWRHSEIYSWQKFIWKLKRIGTDSTIIRWYITVLKRKVIQRNPSGWNLCLSSAVIADKLLLRTRKLCFNENIMYLQKRIHSMLPVWNGVAPNAQLNEFLNLLTTLYTGW